MSNQPTPCKKVRFASKKYADEHIKTRNYTNFEQKILMRSYYCRECNCFHITSRDFKFKLEDDNRNLIIQKNELKSKLRNKHIELLSVRAKALTERHANTDNHAIRDLRTVLNIQKEQIEFYEAEIKHLKSLIKPK